MAFSRDNVIGTVFLTVSSKSLVVQDGTIMMSMVTNCFLPFICKLLFMDMAKVIAALDSELRREILKILVEESATALEVLKKLNRKGMKVKYRETVYRALEKLVDAELVKKFYVRDRGICYRLALTNINIIVTKGSIDIIE
jgi:DNA-binding transcriptional ArsR family regulator